MMGFGLLVPILVVVVVAYVLGWLPNRNEQTSWQRQERSRSSALEILEERYARGEISREEYLEMRDDLTR